jgi:hypothetical protein
MVMTGSACACANQVCKLRIALDPEGLFHSYPDPDAM